ncbi:hypothetical protein PIB30_009569 [Stylosanthes scabra]|uniref:Secreted peptide n=1 Tax=Stylosanthes scabra TaxID=79078 RepID=A0ABU6Q6B3_9FABA|nr:hypothetical protein [Stylosanthes scabra]
MFWIYLRVTVVGVSAVSTISAFSPYSIVALLLLCFSFLHVHSFVFTAASSALNLLFVTSTGLRKISVVDAGNVQSQWKM